MEKLIVVILVVLIILFFFYKRSQRENVLLKSFGLKRSNTSENFKAFKTKTKIDMPPSSQNIKRIQSWAQPITSIHNKNLLVFTWNKPEDLTSNRLNRSRIFALASKRGKRFPKFICRPESLFDKIKSDNGIDYSDHQKFSSKFHLTSQDVSDKKVRELFDNQSLHQYLLDNKTMSIESNGSKIFYYWQGHHVAVEKFPEVIKEIEDIHGRYFDTE